MKKLFRINFLMIILFSGLFLVFFIQMSSPVFAAKTEVKFWTINLSPQYKDYFEKKIIQYEQLNPTIKINWQDINFSAINQQLRYKISAGNSPDLVNLSPQLMLPLLNDNLLFPISDFNFNYSKQYFTKLWQSGSYQNKIYAFPWYFSSKVLAYNKEILKLAGIKKENLQTKADFYQAAAQITNRTKLAAFMPQINLAAEFREAGINLFKSENGELKAAFNTEKAVEIIKKYQVMAEQGIIPKDSLNYSFNVALERYLDNDLAFLITSPQFLTQITADSNYMAEMTDLTALPVGKGKILNGALMNLVIPKTAKNKKEAASFAVFITSAHLQTEFSQLTGVLPSTRESLTEGFLAAEIETNDSLKLQAQKLIADQLIYASDLTLLHPQAEQLTKILTEEFSRAFAGKISARQALNNMEKGWNNILNN
jgi:multiple sugar transport system substrate-binding protein/putative chitobiose transport system substrate-binding protein